MDVAHGAFLAPIARTVMPSSPPNGAERLATIVGGTGFEPEKSRKPPENAMFSGGVSAESVETEGREGGSCGVLVDAGSKKATPSDEPVDPVVAALVSALQAATLAQNFDAVALIVGELRERRLAAAGVIDLAAARAAKGGAK